MEHIMSTDKIDGSILITIRDVENSKQKEAIVIEHENDYLCWLNYCKHITDVKLQKNQTLPRRDDEIICQNHGAMFRVEDGHCTHGPCKGSSLDSIDVSVNNEQLYLTDNEYNFDSVGGIEDSGIPESTTGESDFS